jgi:hypothetical protein
MKKSNEKRKPKSVQRIKARIFGEKYIGPKLAKKNERNHLTSGNLILCP